MEFASPEISKKVRQLMKEKGINYKAEHKLSSANKDVLVFSTADEKSVKENFTLLAYTPKHNCPNVIQDTGLNTKSGWIDVDKQTLQTSFDNVYVIGDITSIHIGNSGDKLLPKAGVFAEYQAKIVAHNITRRLHSKAPDRTFEPKGTYILDQGKKASKVNGDFDSEDPNIRHSSMIRHWEKVIKEKSWFLKNF